MRNRRIKRVPNDKFLEVIKMNTPVCRHIWGRTSSGDAPLDFVVKCTECGKIGYMADFIYQNSLDEFVERYENRPLFKRRWG